MDEIETNGHDEALNLLAEVDDLFNVPPPLAGQLLADDPADIEAQNEAINLEDNVAGDSPQAEGEKKKKKRAFKPRVNLNEERLCSKKGIEALKNLCSDETFKGKGHEASDLNKLLYRFEHWAQCLMPRWPFNNVVKKCELLGSKSRCRNELKRVRQNEEEVLRGEPEDNEEVAGTAGEGEVANEENPAAAAPQQDLPPEQEESPPRQLTEEQLQRMRRNRQLAFEKREANKRRKLAEESQTQSQLDDPPNDSLPTNEENASEQPSITNITSQSAEPEETVENASSPTHQDIATNEKNAPEEPSFINFTSENGEPEESIEDTINEIHQDIATNEENGPEEPDFTNITSQSAEPEESIEDTINEIHQDIATNEENSPEEPDFTNITSENAETDETIEDARNETHHDIAANGEDQIDSMDDINEEEIESNVERHNGMPEKDDSSQLSDVNGERNDDEESDSDDDILSRSAFLPVETSDADGPNSNTKDDNTVLLQDNSHPNDTTENSTLVLENDIVETDRLNSDDATQDINSNTCSLGIKHVNMLEDPCVTSTENTQEACAEQMDVDTTE